MRRNYSINTLNNILLLLAAGLGKRLNTNIPKALVKIKNKTLLHYILEKIYKLKNIDLITITYPKRFKKNFQKIIDKKYNKILLIQGGKERNISVYNALNFINENFSINRNTKILIHDAARVLTPIEIFNKCLKTIKKQIGVIPFLKINDTLRNINNNVLDRDKFILTQTPQGFLFKEILKAYNNGFRDNFFATDDATYYQKYIGNIKLIKGHILNFKLTYKEQLQLLKKII